MSKNGKKFFVTVVFVCIFVVGTMLYHNVNSSRAENTQAFKLNFGFEPKGTRLELEIPGNFIYHFSAPNENVLVYKINDMFVVGTDDGNVYGNLISTNAQFLGISPEYLLLLTEDGVIAFNFPFEKGHDEVHAFEALSDQEQEQFIFPCSYEIEE